MLDATDCNDVDATINNDAVETCNGLDDNCNGLVDEGAESTAPLGSSTFYADSDGDGFGDASVSVLQCSSPSGYVTNSEDCDDNVGTTYPNATEFCNGLDDDCDGSTDEEDAVDKLEWFEDSDSDGFGNGGVGLFDCNQPVGFVSVSGDCDDDDGAVSPNATEVCNGYDDNCDGLTDDADANLDLNTATEFFEDADADGYGNSTVSILTCIQSPGFVTNSDDCDDGNLLRNPNGYEYCNNIDDNCDGTVDELAVDATTYFVDSDGDGHGSLVDVSNGYDLISCPTFDAITNLPLNPTGYAQSNDDCDDGDASISPSANELCSNGIDENCDGHNTAGATDVSTFLVDADGDTFGSGERDSNGDLAYALDLCVQPYGYVPYSEGDGLDCDDGDFDVKPGAVELCNGKRDDCPSDGDNSVPADESDDDGDGFVECVLDPSTYVVMDTEEDDFGQVHDLITVNNWSDSTVTILGGGDCDDNDVDAYPGAVELCNGAFENCWDPLFTVQGAPEAETDDDEDCFVECSGFDVTTWEGGVHTCEHLDIVGQIVQEAEVIGGDDCNDGNPYTYIGAAINNPTLCLQDDNFDGDGDCSIPQGSLNPPQNYFCDVGLFFDNEIGIDFVYVPAGADPLGRYTLSNSFFIMTTEVTVGMWDEIIGSGWQGQDSLVAKGGVNLSQAQAFANALSSLTSRDLCYPTDGTSPYLCNGFRLPTTAEWEYAARSGTTSDFWTGSGSELGGTFSANTCLGSERIIDGNTNPLIGDYMWYCGNDTGLKSVAQKLPNGFGLYDVHGHAG